jgi:hypothetical protein
MKVLCKVQIQTEAYMYIDDYKLHQDWVQDSEELLKEIVSDSFDSGDIKVFAIEITSPNQIEGRWLNSYPYQLPSPDNTYYTCNEYLQLAQGVKPSELVVSPL